MGQDDFPLCIHCDSVISQLEFDQEFEQAVYHCGNCGNSVVVKGTNG